MKTFDSGVRPLSFIDLPPGLAVRLMVRWSLFTSFVTAVLFWLFLVCDLPMLLSIDGHSRWWDVLAGPVWSVVIFGSLLLYTHTLGNRAPALETAGKMYFSKEAVLLILSWLTAFWGIVQTVAHGLAAGLHEATMPLILVNAGLVCFLFDIPGYVMTFIGLLKDSDWPLCKFLTGD